MKILSLVRTSSAFWAVMVILSAGPRAATAQDILSYANSTETNESNALDIIRRDHYNCEKVISVDFSEPGGNPAVTCNNGKIYHIEMTKKGGKVYAVRDTPPPAPLVAATLLPSLPISDNLRDLAIRTAEQSVMNRLNDPHSFERTGGRILSTEHKGVKIIMIDIYYLAKNGFGGVGRHEAMVTLDDTGTRELLFVPVGGLGSGPIKGNHKAMVI